MSEESRSLFHQLTRQAMAAKQSGRRDVAADLFQQAVRICPEETPVDLAHKAFASYLAGLSYYMDSGIDGCESESGMTSVQSLSWKKVRQLWLGCLRLSGRLTREDLKQFERMPGGAKLSQAIYSTVTDPLMANCLTPELTESLLLIDEMTLIAALEDAAPGVRRNVYRQLAGVVGLPMSLRAMSMKYSG